MPDGTSDGLAVLDDQLKLELPARPKVLDIANAFQKLFGKAIEYRKAKPQDNARLVGLLVQEIDRAVKLHPEAKGWYDENVKLTMDVMRELDPDIAKPENDFIFKAILAATSDGNKVGPQFQQTWKEYSNWKNTGEISGEFVSGDRIENIQTNLEMLNEMIKDVGWEKTKDFMVQKGTVKELRQALMDVFGWTKKQAQSIGSSELADEVVPFAVVLGPKLGSFFNNLYGDFSSVTMDRWFMRTLGRLTGTQVAPLAASKLREMRNNLRSAVERLTPSQFERLGIKRSDIRGSAIDDTATTIAGRFAKKDLRTEAKKLSAEGQSALEETRKFANALKKGLNPLVEAPVDGTHRRWIRERIAEVQKELRSRGIELENADLQAVLWYLEKELYEKLKYRSKSGESDYASAASSLYQSVAGRPSDVYAGGTGRVRAIGSAGGSEGMGTGQASQAAGPEVGVQRFMPSDTDYLSAVKAGDTAAAQRMVDEAAKAAGYTVGPVWHGGAKPTVFNVRAGEKTSRHESSALGSFFSDSEETASQYGNTAPYFLRIENPIELSEREQSALDTVAKARLFRMKAKQDGFDGAIIRTQDATGFKGGTEYVAFDPTQIKSADPITRDDQGNIVPLSQRFQTSSADIRFMPVPDSSMPGAYSFTGGYRALPGKSKGSLRIYSPAGSLIGIAASLDEAQRIIRRKAQQ